MKHILSTRRDFNARMAASLGSGLLTMAVREANARPDAAAGSPIERYKAAENRLFKKYGVEGRSFQLGLRKPALSLRILEGGKGDPVVMIHGGGATLAEYAPLIGPLESDFHIYAPDRPGCGLSEMIDYKGVPMRQQAVDCMSSLFDQLGLQRAAVVGCSIGGYWALVFGLAAPERVSKIVLTGSPAASGAHWPMQGPPPRSAQPAPTLASIKDGYRFLMADANRASAEMVETALAAAEIPGAALAWDSMVAAAHQQFPVPMSYALRPELKNLKQPTLFLMGDRDMEGPPSQAKEMAALAPHGRFELIPDAGHLIWLDQPERVRELTRDFLKTS